MTQDAMYATAPKTQLRPEPGTPGASGFGNLATLHARQYNAPYHTKRNSLDQNKYGVEIKKRLYRDMGKDKQGK